MASGLPAGTYQLTLLDATGRPVLAAKYEGARTHALDALEGIGRNAERRDQESAGAVAPRQAASSCCSSKSRSGRMIASSDTY